MARPSPPTRCTAKSKPRGSSQKEAANTSFKSKATNPRSCNTPAPRRPPTPPFCPDRLRTWTHRRTGGEPLRSSTDGHRLPLQPRHRENQKHPHRKEKRTPEYRRSLLPLQPGQERTHPRGLDQPEPLPLG